MTESVVGAGLALVAALALAVQSLAVRRGTRTHRVAEVVAVMFVVNLLVLVPVAAVAAYPRYAVPAPALAAFATAGILGSLLARVRYFVGIARLGASRTEPLKALFPAVSVAVALLVLGEQVTPLLVGGAVLLVGGGLVVAAEARASPVTATGRRLWLDVSFPLAAAVLLGVDPVFTELGLATGTSALVGSPSGWSRPREGSARPSRGGASGAEGVSHSGSRPTGGSSRRASRTRSTCSPTTGRSRGHRWPSSPRCWASARCSSSPAPGCSSSVRSG